MAKTLFIVASDMDKTPLQYLQEHSGYCDGAAHIVESFTELREMGHRFQGVWKITIEKAKPQAVRVWRKVSKRACDDTEFHR